MKNINISDSTLRYNSSVTESPLSFKERLEIARTLDRMNVDVIEFAPIENEKTDVLLARTITSFLNHAKLAIPVGFCESAIEVAALGIGDGTKARIQIRVPTSPVQMEYFCHKKPPVVLEMIKTLSTKAAATGAEVEFVAEDATRAELPFLSAAIKTAVECGASVVTLCDNEGKMIPAEFAAFISSVFDATDSLSDVKVAVECSNNLGLALANIAEVINSNITEVKCAVSGDRCLSLKTFANFISARGLEIGIACDIKKTELLRLIGQIEWILSSKRSLQTVESGPTDSNDEVVLTAKDDITTVCAAISKLGYELSEDDAEKVYEEFCRVASKKTVTNAELDAIVASAALQVAPTYILKSYVINSGNLISSTAHIVLDKNDTQLEGVSIGDGPIDAAFLAIEQIIGHHYELDDFQIKSVTEGRQALGSAIVKLRAGGKLYSGNGLSTDIIGASIRAYISALNKIAYEENLI